MEKPTACPNCSWSLVGIKWGLFHGLQGPVDFTQCPACGQIIHLPPKSPEVPIDAQQIPR